MESDNAVPTPHEAAALLAGADAGRAGLAGDIEVPGTTHAVLGAAVAVHLALTAVGLTRDQPTAGYLVVAGVLAFALGAGVALAGFRRRNGVHLGGYASRVVLGTATWTSVTYAAALVAAYAAASHGLWWLVVGCAVAGGTAYGLSGRIWLRTYRRDPVRHARAESAAWLALVGGLAVVGLVLLVVGR